MVKSGAERFWSKVRKTGTCWRWIGAQVKEDGYGAFRFNGRNVVAHRVSWILHFGEIPRGLWVLHRCDTPCCIRPDHLFLGTRSDNMRDMARKGRGNWTTKPYTVPRGERNGNSKLTKAQVHDIRKRYAQGIRQVEIAKDFGVTQAAVSLIVRGETWTHPRNLDA